MYAYQFCRKPTARCAPSGDAGWGSEVFPAPRSWVQAVYPSLTYFNEVDRAGHFAAWEEPEVFSTELRAAFRPLR
jgi:pimeloyl-ACP methyl ester carboxylesterase